MEKHIFFLKYTNQLPLEFFYLARVFAEWGVKLVPVRPQDLATLMNSQKIFAISLDNSMAVHRHVLAYRKQFLEYALMNRRLVLFDISSFGKMVAAYKAERTKCYFHVPLPDTMVDVAKTIALAYFRDKKDARLWPGGKRAKLPAA